MMYTCYDCEHFGSECEGVIPPDKFRNKVEEFCKKFKVISWREDMFKDGGRKRLGK